MQLFDPNNPNEKKKIIAGAALFVIAMAVLGYVFFGGSSKQPTANQNLAVGPRPVGSPKPTPEATPEGTAFLKPIPASWSVPIIADPSRNIFAFYQPTPTPVKVPYVPTPSPTPTP